MCSLLICLYNNHNFPRAQGFTVCLIIKQPFILTCSPFYILCQNLENVKRNPDLFITCLKKKEKRRKKVIIPNEIQYI